MRRSGVWRPISRDAMAIEIGWGAGRDAVWRAEGWSGSSAGLKGTSVYLTRQICFFRHPLNALRIDDDCWHAAVGATGATNARHSGTTQIYIPNVEMGTRGWEFSEWHYNAASTRVMQMNKIIPWLLNFFWASPSPDRPTDRQVLVCFLQGGRLKSLRGILGAAFSCFTFCGSCNRAARRR